VITLEKVALIAHDAGGAEILASYAIFNKSKNFEFVLSGPAVKVFNRRFESLEIKTFDEVILNVDWCLCGTGWQSDFEWRAIEQARLKGKRIVVFLDHWINYPERFIRNGVQMLPDEIWVGDEYAERIAINKFPGVNIRLVANPYWLEIKNQLAAIELDNKKYIKTKCLNILYVCENTSEHARLRYGDESYFGYTEFDSIDYFLDNIASLTNKEVNIVIRPHPSDLQDKYEGILNTSSVKVTISKEKNLINDIAGSDMVVGCESMAMVIGVLAAKKVISVIPNVNMRCRLPHQEIIHLSDLLGVKST
jgi:hypothetical protein